MKPSERADIVLDIMGIPRHPKVREPIERGITTAERVAFEAGYRYGHVAWDHGVDSGYDDWRKERGDED